MCKFKFLNWFIHLGWQLQEKANVIVERFLANECTILSFFLHIINLCVRSSFVQALVGLVSVRYRLISTLNYSTVTCFATFIKCMVILKWLENYSLGTNMRDFMVWGTKSAGRKNYPITKS